MLQKKRQKFMVLCVVLLVFVPTLAFGAMSGGGYEIYADTFSATSDSAEATGGTYSLRSTGGEIGAETLQTGATGTISTSDGDVLTGETFYLSDGFASRTFRFTNLAGGGNGTVDGDGAVFVDYGGGALFNPNAMAIRIRDAINDEDAHLSIEASSSGFVVTVLNLIGGSSGNVDITETVDSANFVVVGMSGGGSSYTLLGGFQAMEKGILSLSFSTSSAGLATLSLIAISSSTVSSTITTDSLTGYSLTFDEDGNLRDGTNDINDVVDGTVTLGVEEYGVRTIGGGGALGGVDTAIVDGLEVASSVGSVNDEETGIQFRVAIGGSTLAGDYAHVVTATLSANP